MITIDLKENNSVLRIKEDYDKRSDIRMSGFGSSSVTSLYGILTAGPEPVPVTPDYPQKNPSNIKFYLLLLYDNFTHLVVSVSTPPAGF